MARYRLTQTEPRVDGTGDIMFDVWGLNDDGEILPSKHINILVPASEVQSALAGSSPGPDLRAALIANAPVGWSGEELEEAAEQYAEDTAANENARAIDGMLDDYVVSDLGGYPVEFNA